MSTHTHLHSDLFGVLPLMAPPYGCQMYIFLQGAIDMGPLPNPTVLEMDIEHLARLIDNIDIDVYAAFYHSDHYAAVQQADKWLAQGYVDRDHASVLLHESDRLRVMTPLSKVGAVLEPKAPVGCEGCGNPEYCDLFGCVEK